MIEKDVYAYYGFTCVKNAVQPRAEDIIAKARAVESMKNRRGLDGRRTWPKEWGRIHGAWTMEPQAAGLEEDQTSRMTVGKKS